MAKKVQAFQIVSEAIDLDSNDLHEEAIIRYLQCLQSLSSYLVEQLSLTPYSTMKDNPKKAAKQVLTVICDCADRANAIFKVGEDGRNSPCFSRLSDGKSAQDAFRHCDILDSLKTTKDSSQAVSNVPQIRLKPPILEKLQKDNEYIFRKYQRQIEVVKDGYAKQNLELELQRTLSENLMIAQTKQKMMMKQEQEERKAALEATMRNFMLEGPCPNKSDQEKRELYIEVLKYEVGESGLVSSDFVGLPTSEIIEAILQRTLRCSNHPLTQWLIMVQIRLKKELFALVKEFSSYIPLLPGPVANNGNQRMSQSFSGREDLMELNVALEDVTLSVRTATNAVVEILYTVFKSQLSDDAEILAFKLTESLLVIPLWCLLISLARIANIESEWHVVDTMRKCQQYPQEWSFPSLITSEQEDLYRYNANLLRKMPELLSPEEKLSLFVQVSRNVCECPQVPGASTDGSKKMLGADELVPILSYVLVQVGLPQILSECRMLELLIDPKYMLGEDGYSLTSFQTALNYLEMKQVISPFNSLT